MPSPHSDSPAPSGPSSAAGPAPFVRRTLSAGKRAGWFTLGRLAPLHASPVIVLGNQKAGTTAVAALLAQYAGLSATLDFRYLTPAWLRGVHDGSVSLNAFVRHHALDFSRGLVKEPNLSLLYSGLAKAFPEARFVMVVRDPRDNVRSVLNRLGLPGDAEHLPDGWAERVNPVWKLVLDGQWLGLGGGHYVEALAARWSAIADVYFKHHERIRLVRYEDFLADKEGSIAALADGCGLAKRNAIADRLDVQFQPRGDRSASWATFFGHANLQRLQDRCGDRPAVFGYPPGAGPTAAAPSGRAER